MEGAYKGSRGGNTLQSHQQGIKGKKCPTFKSLGTTEDCNSYFTTQKLVKLSRN